MKVWGTILKILAALAAIAGVVFVVATYGDKIVGWAKQLIEKMRCGKSDVVSEEDLVQVEEAEVVEESTEEAVQAEEKDFENE